MPTQHHNTARSGLLHGHHVCVIVLIFAHLACAPKAKLPTYSAVDLAGEAAYQRRLTVQEFLKNGQRIDNVAWPILEQNVALCGADVRWDIGVSVVKANEIPKDDQGAWSAVAGVGVYPTIIAVAERSPAIQLLHPGDQIQIVNGSSLVPTDKKSATEQTPTCNCRTFCKCIRRTWWG